jgi:hypothetical protein
MTKQELESFDEGISQSKFLEAIEHRLGKLTGRQVKQCWNSRDLTIAHINYLSDFARWYLIPSKYSYDEGRYITHMLHSGLIESNECPSYLLRVLAKHACSDERCAVAENKECPDDILITLAEDTDLFVRWAVAENPACPKSVLWNFLKDGIDLGTLHGIAINPKSPSDILEELSGDLDTSTRLAIIASNPNCNIELMEVFAIHQEPIVQAYLAANPSFPVERRLDLVKKLTQCSDDIVLKIIASNPLCPEGDLSNLAKNSDSDIRVAIASNPNCPSSLIKELVEDKDYMVFTVAAENPNCSTKLLETLANTSGAKKAILKHIARNKSCPISALSILSKVKDGAVRSAVAANANCTEELLLTLSKVKIDDVIYSVISNALCPIHVLEKLAIHGNKIIRMAVANHSNCTESLQLAIFRKPEMMKLLASTLLLKPETLVVLAEQGGETIKAAAIANMNHPEWQKTLYSDLKNNPWLQAQLNKASAGAKTAYLESDLLYFEGKDANKSLKSNNPIRRILALTSKEDLKVDEIKKVSKSQDWLERMAVAQNPKTPKSILDGMVLDAKMVK